MNFRRKLIPAYQLPDWERFLVALLVLMGIIIE